MDDTRKKIIEHLEHAKEMLVTHELNYELSARVRDIIQELREKSESKLPRNPLNHFLG